MGLRSVGGGKLIDRRSDLNLLLSQRNLLIKKSQASKKLESQIEILMDL